MALELSWPQNPSIITFLNKNNIKVASSNIIKPYNSLKPLIIINT